MVDLGQITKLPIIGGAITGIVYGFLILVGLGLVGFAGYMYFYRRKHNIPVIVVSERSGQNPKITMDKGGYFKKKDQWIFRLLGMKKIISPPSPQFLHTSGSGKNVLMLHQKGLDSFVPVYFDFSQQDLKFKVADMDTQLWADSMKELFAKTFMKLNWMQKYGSYVIFGITAMMCILLIYLTLQKFDTISAGIGGVAKSIEHTAQSVGQCIQNVPKA